MDSTFDIRPSSNKIQEVNSMASKTFKVPNISCGHCVMTIQREVGELEGVLTVKAEQADQMVSVEWNEPPASWDTIKDLLVEINYPPEMQV
jgi:copper chaperone CopZ